MRGETTTESEEVKREKAVLKAPTAKNQPICQQKPDPLQVVGLQSTTSWGE
jgi:hypothetical protein